MDQKLLRERETRCNQENPPGCTAGCPVHVDARGIIAAIRKGDYATGLSLFHRMVPFPGIISRVCDQPCQHACKRKELDEPISINLLERICVDSNKLASSITCQPPKNKKVAVVGAGLSGLTVALELSRKGYKVVVFEATDRLGGSIWNIPESKLPRYLIKNDFQIFDQISLEIHLNTEVASRSLLPFVQLYEHYDAVYLGLGSRAINALDLNLELNADGNIVIDSLTFATSHPKVFAGGSIRRCDEGQSPIVAITDGKIATNSIDRLLQNASLTANREKEGPFTTTLYTNIEGVERQPRVAALDTAGGYTKEEALQEANRCLLCECRECVKNCEYLGHYRSYPKRYVREVYNNLSIVMGIHHANKMINSCSLCGLCEQICPGKLNMAEVFQEARQMMVRKGKMPPSAHDFALRDMKFSNSNKFVLNKHQPGFTFSTMVFYPGCQLAASSPQYVKKMYQFLAGKIDGGIGLMLNCCGAPAAWAGQEERFQQTMQDIKENWRNLGSPKVIAACPTCYNMFTRNLPDMPVETLWTVLDRVGVPDSTLALSPQRLAIHDSCTTRNEMQLQDSVRNILRKLGHQVEELPLSRNHTVCCGYGGLMTYTNREVAHKVINRRIKESSTDYVTYCTMCRDNFIGQGKRAYYLMDLIFGSEQESLIQQANPGYSQRQENRERLKISLLREIWGETVEDSRKDVKIIIPESVRRVMEDRMILDDDIVKVIAHAESTGNKLKNTETDCFIGYFQPDRVTYWVEYFPQNDGFLVQNAYCHRLEILE